MRFNLKYFFSLISLLFLSSGLHLAAQASDNFSGAELISISKQDFGLGVYQSSLVSLANAGVEPSEFFPDDLIRAGNINKTIWFKFKIASNRDVNIILKQKDSAILQSDVGITIYENPNNWAGKHSLCAGLPALTKFGSVGNTCLKSGEYYIQVCARTRVVDSVFIELNIQLPNSPYSDPYNPKEVIFPTGSNNWSGVSVSNCAYVIEKDFYPLQSLENYNRAVNWRFHYNSTKEFLKMDLVNFTVPQGKRFLLLILKEDPAKPIKDWVIFDSTSVYSSYISKSFGCLSEKSMDVGTYRAVFLYKDTDFYSGTIRFGLIRNDKEHDNAIPTQIEASHILGEITNGNLKDTFHCNSAVENNTCMNLKKDALYYVFQQDTIYYDLQSWYTFKVSKEKIIDIRAANNQGTLKMVLYDGDITKSCNLTELERRTPFGNQEYCVQSGTYSLRVLRYNQTGNLSINTLTHEVIIKLSAITVSNNLYTDSLAPQVLPDVATSSPFTIVSDNNFFSSDNQKIYTGKDTLYGNVIYREFHYVNSAIPLELFVNYQAILFKGRKSISNQTEFVERFGRSKTFYCASLDTGWYTLIQIYGSYNNQRKCLSVNDARDELKIKNAVSCQNSTLGTIPNPEMLNNGAKIFADTKIIDGVSYPETRILDIKYKCIECFTDASKYRDWLKSKCLYNSSYEGLGVIEFELGEEMDMHLSQGSASVYLIRGSLKNNPSSLYDSASYIFPCSYANNYCRLQKGKYSLVVFANFPQFNYSISFSFVPTRSFPNTDIEKPEDLGQINGPAKSNPMLFNCLIFNDTSYRLPVNLNGRPFTTKVDYPLNERGLLFYTFHVQGNGQLRINPEDEVFLFRFKEGIDVQSLLNDPQWRDSIINNLDYLKYGNSTTQPIVEDITRCGRTDFMIVTRNIYWRLIPKNRQLTLSFAHSPVQPSPHDYCTTAQLLNISSNGSFSEKFDTRCTTIGEGFGEDGNNMACLPEDENFGTFWAKIKIDPGTSYDVSFRLSALPGVSFGPQVKYRILYGSCGGLNPGPCLSSLNTYIGFDCMEPGEYFLQIAIPKQFYNPSKLTEFLKLDVDVISPKSLTCKPFDPKRPLASFNFKGNCELDSIRFQNYSSQGTEIDYLWDFGDGSTSTLKDPIHWYNFSGTHKDYLVKLWVSNTVHNLHDSFERYLRVWKDPLRMDLNFTDTLINCNSELYIEASSNLPDVFFYYVINTNNDTVIDNSLLERFRTPSKVSFVMFTAGCYIDSSVTIDIDQNLYKLPPDTLICGLKDIVLDVSPYKLATWTPGFIYSPKLTVDKAGTYIVLVEDSGCMKRDTIAVREYRKAFDPPVDTVLCNLDSFELTLPAYLQQILWYDQSSSYSKYVNSNGKYGVTAYWDDCLLYDTASVRFSDLKNPITDNIDSLCLETGIEIGTDEFATSYLWNTGETTSKIWADTAGIYRVTLKSGTCEKTDSIQIIEYPKTYTLFSDTSVCGNFEVHLDAGIGSNYLWWPINSSARIITVRDSGTFNVFKINKYGCEERDTVQVLENCGPYFLMPNSFTPNGDGKNDRLTWAHPDVTEFNLIIFDRWGEVIFQSTDPAGYWDGTYKNAALPDGTYYYQVTYGGFDWTGAYFRKNDKGFILLLN